MDTDKNRKLISIEIFKYNENSDEKFQHYTTAAIKIPGGTYEELLEQCNYELLT